MNHNLSAENSASNFNVPTDSGIRLDLLLKTQQTILARVLPHVLSAIEAVTDYMYEPESDDEDIHHHLRELAAEAFIDERTRLLTRDHRSVSKQYMMQDADGIGMDTLIASYDELLPERAERYYARRLQLQPEAYQSLSWQLPAHMDW